MPTKSHGEVQYVNGKRVATPEYRAWQAMRNRTGNPNSRSYQYYGGRGIGVHPSWDRYEQFLRDMGRRPGPEYTLDRVDGDGDYSPENCRWATRETQARNRSYCKTKSWLLAERLGVKKMTAHFYIWQVRSKDKGETQWFSMSPELEAKVREHLHEIDTYSPGL